jgi:flagellar biogenesis protein FliO
VAFHHIEATFAAGLVLGCPTMGSGSYSAFLLETILILVGVCVLVWVVLRFGVRRLYAPTGANGPIRVVARQPLEPRRTLYIIEAGGKTLLIGVSDGGPMTTLAELDGNDVERDLPRARRSSFLDLLIRSRSPSSPAQQPPSGSSPPA